MYDLPEIRDATDGFWQDIANAYGAESPLTRGEDHAAPWRDPALLFSQTCGYPLTHEFADTLTYIATPHYAADGCDGPNYCSILFARENLPLEELGNKKAAFNSTDSMSGMLALKLMLNTTELKHTIETGSHVASLTAVQKGKADICAIDCVTVELLRNHRPSALQGLVEIARSPKVPGLPYVTRGGDVEKLRRILINVSTTQNAKALLINGISVLPAGSYNVILKLEDDLNGKGRN
jgi:ABC-type phosphate/phosphonate transport system substrate-binding protein